MHIYQRWGTRVNLYAVGQACCIRYVCHLMTCRIDATPAASCNSFALHVIAVCLQLKRRLLLCGDPLEAHMFVCVHRYV